LVLNESTIARYAAAIKSNTHIDEKLLHWFDDKQIVHYFRPALRFTNMNMNTFQLPKHLPAPDKSLYKKIVSNVKLIGRLCSNLHYHGKHFCTEFLLYNARFFVFPKSTIKKFKLDNPTQWNSCFIDIGNYFHVYEIAVVGEAHELGEHLMYCRVGYIPSNIHDKTLALTMTTLAASSTSEEAQK